MKILILDDEVLARQELTYLIEHSQVVSNPEIFQAEDIDGAEKILFRQPIDLLFLDISLSEENGFSLAKRLKKLAHPPFLVFATAYDNYAVKAFEANAADYILKPFEQERIDQSLAKVQRIHQLTQEQANPSDKGDKKSLDLLSLALADRSIVLKVQEIVSANIEDGLLSVSTEKKSYQVKKTLNWFKTRVRASNFLQIHRNTVVNLEMIHEVQPWFNHTLLLVMTNGEKFPVGRSYLKELNAHLTL
ncbi:LytTR family transcriptional regulator DNA-binding domain-containing protein [Streptococcus sobrinus]|uniref:Putative sensory transduction protein LytT n=3 Tax=Streptococcus sobrinus TaxID=1310 RepID=U2J1Q8_9STRE|nr:LytTR family transcriptional regulator DNA-binding domain-containing protein [Streptococcus sobrinus]ERJ73982.1 putative sensory transduction protein LytT [Streptococcus sobrinus W1703]